MLEPQVGNYGVVATGGVVGWLIRLATFSRYNHAFIVGPNDQIMEAQPGGARIGHISQYPHARYNTRTVLTPEQRHKIWANALSCRGIGYGWLDDVALGLRFFGVWLPWVNKRIARQDRLQCAQLVDQAYSLAGVTLFDDGRLSMAVTPGDLADILAD